MPAIHANKWFVDFSDLDTDQKRLVNNELFEKGNSVGLIMGPAGSGKTIILTNTLSKADSKSVLFVSYTHALLNLAKQGLPETIRAVTYRRALGLAPNYDLIVVDEVQDIPLEAIRTIISKAKRVLLAGDNFQKIYENGISSNDLNLICESNIRKLQITYRLTPSVFAAANKVLPGALENALPNGRNRVDIELYFTETYEQGGTICYDFAKKKSALRRTAAILLPTKEAMVDFANNILLSEQKPIWILRMTDGRFPTHDFGSLNSHLKSHSIKLQIVQNDFGDLNNAVENNEAVLQTYHSSKGLDYEFVFLPNASPESASRSQFQKAIFYVAITRASGALLITQQKDSVSPLVKSIEEFCTVIDSKRLADDEEEF